MSNRRLAAAASLVLTFALALALALPGLAAAQQRPPEGMGGPVKPVDEAKIPAIVAKVNGVDIKKTDLENAVETIKAQLQLVGQSVPGDRKDEMYRGLLDDLIATELLAQEAASKKIGVPEKEIDEFIQKFKDRFPSEEVFQRAIKEQGITETQLRGDVKKQISIKKLLDKEVLAKVSVDDAAVKKFYTDNPDKFQEPEQLHASHVLVGIDGIARLTGSKLDVWTEADGVRSQARANTAAADGSVIVATRAGAGRCDLQGKF